MYPNRFRSISWRPVAWGTVALGTVLLLVAACGPGAGERSATEPQQAPAPPIEPPTVGAAAPPQADRPTVVFLGDSLTAGLGLAASQAFPALVEQALREAGEDVKVVNAGVSGATTAGGLRQLDWLLRQAPDVMVIALGGNDGLRGVELESTAANLRAMVTRVRAAGVHVILAGMLIPPNYGPEYAQRFASLYPALADELGVDLIPFLLAGVAGDPALNQADGIHPTAVGQQRVAEIVLPFVETALGLRPDD